MKNLTRLNDVLVKSANSANVTIENQFETMKIAAPIFAIFGDNLEQVAALTAAMGNAGIKGSQGATALKNAILRLAAPTPKVSAGMAELGLKLEDISTIGKDGKRNLKPMTTILKTMGPLLKKLGTKDQAAVLDAIFGKRAIAAVGNLTGVIDSVIKFEGELKNAGGTAQKTADLMRKSLGNRIKILQSAALDLGFRFLNAFKGQGVDAITALTKAIKKFDVGPIIKAMKALFALLKLIFTIMKLFVPVIEFVIAGFIGLKLALLASSASLVVFGVALSATGIGAFVVIFGLLIGGFLKLVNATGSISGAFKVIGKSIMQFLLTPINFVLTSIKNLLLVLSKIPGIGGKIKPAFEAIAGFQEKINKPFEITEFDEKKKAPNSAEVQARNNLNLDQQININAPKGTTVEAKSRTAPSPKMALLGAQ